MKKFILLCLRAVAVIIIGTAAGMSSCKTTVFVTNKTPYTFTPTFVQTGPGTLADKKWNKNADPIKPNEIKHKLTAFARDKGVSENHLWEYLSTPAFQNKLAFAQHIWKKQLRFGMEFTIQVPEMTEKWTSDEWYFWDNYIKISWTDNTGAIIPLEIRCRPIPQFPRGNFKDLEYVISKPLNKYVENPKLAPTGPETISILSFNTYLMTLNSMEIFKFVPLFAPKLNDLEKPGVPLRSKLLPEAIGPDFDVLALSEVWDSDARFNLLKGLKNQGYKYATCILGSGFMSEWGKYPPIEIIKRIKHAEKMIKERTDKSLEQPWIIDFNDPRFGIDKNYTIGGNGTFPKGVDLALVAGPGFIGNGGVIIVSKWPIKEVREWIFKTSTKTDKYAKKGALYAKIDKGGKLYNIIATHTAGEINITSIAAFVDTLDLPANEPVIMAGDWNTNLFEQKAAFATLKSTIPQWIGSKITADSETNALKLWDTINHTIDFIICSNSHLLPSKASVTVRKITSKMPWSDNKYPFAKEKPVRNIYDLSDHYGLVGILTFD